MTNFDEKTEKEILPYKCLSDPQIFKDHVELRQRLQKTFYYSKLPETDCSSLPLTEFTVELFSSSVPDYGLKVLDTHYAASVSRKACISPCSMMLAMVYLEQLRRKNPEYLQTVSSYDLFLVSMMVASKFLYDEGEVDEVFNSEWAVSANMDVKELNQLEMEFLAAIDWNLYVKPSAFFSLIHYAETRIAKKEISKRGWLTYTDIWVLSQGSVMIQCWATIVDSVVQIIVVSMIAYTAAALTLVGSVMMVNQCYSINKELRNRIENTQLFLKPSVMSHNMSSGIRDIQNSEENIIEKGIQNIEFHQEYDDWKHSLLQNAYNVCSQKFPFVRTLTYQTASLKLHTFLTNDRQLKQPG